jgi:hypothetical protein
MNIASDAIVRHDQAKEDDEIKDSHDILAGQT